LLLQHNFFDAPKKSSAAAASDKFSWRAEFFAAAPLDCGWRRRLRGLAYRNKMTAINKEPPAVIKFAFAKFTENSVSKKWSAKCQLCNSVLLTETIGVTSGFTK
jgi:hypothetical protein